MVSLGSEELRPAMVAHACNPSTLLPTPRQVDHRQSGVQDQPGQRVTLPWLKIQELARHGAACLQSQLLRRLRQENYWNPGGRGCSEPRLHHYTPAWATEQHSVSKKSKKIKRELGTPDQEPGKQNGLCHSFSCLFSPRPCTSTLLGEARDKGQRRGYVKTGAYGSGLDFTFLRWERWVEELKKTKFWFRIDWAFLNW